jgi:hypothetical protein
MLLQAQHILTLQIMLNSSNLLCTSALFATVTSALLQHGERAVRTPFSPLGFMPVLPTPSEQQQQTETLAAAVATDADAETPPDADSAAAAAAVEPVQLYNGVTSGSPWCVTLVFPEVMCPERLVFVVHQLESDAWVRDHGANFSLQLRSPCLGDLVEGVLAAEGGYEHWGLLHRLQRVLELLDNAEAAGELYF